MGEARARCASCNKEIIETYWNVNSIVSATPSAGPSK